MGNKHSNKKSPNSISDFSIIKVPKNFILLKAISFYIDLKISANIDLKISEIINYIFSSVKNKSADIINLQGIYDVVALHLLIREIKKYSITHDFKLYFAPEFNDIDIDNNNTNKTEHNRTIRRSKNLEEFYTGTNSRDGKKNKSDKKFVHNIIISRFPIVGTIFSELDDKTNMDDIFGIQTVIGANILIDNTIISVYNTCLSKDIRTSNITNTSVRTTEIETLCNTINKNKKSIEHDKQNYIKSDIHMIIGNLNIPEITNDDVNEEYIKLLKNTNCVDVFRYKSLTDLGYTTLYKERNSYMLLQISENLYNNFEQMEHETVLSELFKKYKIHFIDLYVISSNKNIINFPIECVVMVQTK
jgi:hypothetical protein